MSVGSEIRKTPFHQMHVDAGAKMVPFAGYEMPVSYPLGIKKEHTHTQEKELGSLMYPTWGKLDYLVSRLWLLWSL